MFKRFLSIFSGLALVLALAIPGNTALAALEDKVIVCHVIGNGGTETLEINANSLDSHLAHGDSEGECAPVVVEEPVDEPEAEITICHEATIEEELDLTMVVLESELQAHLNHGDYFGECVADEEEPEEELPPIEEEPNGDQLVTICHFPPLHPEDPETIEVSVSQLAQYWQFGDHLGECEDGDTPQGNLVTICHFFPNHPEFYVTAQIRAFAVPHHLSHGDHVGACLTDDVPGDDEEEGDEEEEGDGEEEEGGDEGGEEDEEDDGDNGNDNLVTICHEVGTENEMTIEVAEAAVDSHLEHGDVVGACEDEGDDEGEDDGDDQGGGDDDEEEDLVAICALNELQVLVTLEVLESEVQAYLDLGATLGACVDEETGGGGDDDEDEEDEGGDDEGGDDEGGDDEGGDDEGGDDNSDTPSDNGGGGTGGSGVPVTLAVFGGGSSNDSPVNLASEDDDSTGGSEEDEEITLSETDCEEPFDDVTGSYVYYSDVVDGYCNGEISGFDDGHEQFGPNQDVVFGHFIKMLVRGSGLVETPHVDGSGVDQYADVLEDEGHMDESMRDKMNEELTTEDAEELTNSVSGDEVEFDNTDRGYVLHILHTIFGN